MESRFRPRHISIFALLLFALLILPAKAFSARRVTVDELGRILVTTRAPGVSDSDVAQRIAALELTERPSPSTVDLWFANSPGPKTSAVITSLVDLATFLDPPPGALSAEPQPDLPEQRRIMSHVIDFVAGTLAHLPNFFADRVTTSYDDSPQAFKQGDWPIRLGLHVVGTNTAEIAFRDGRETDDPAIKNVKAVAHGLTSWGEFGPILTLVITDAARGKLEWGRWEDLGSSRLAVFRFSVAREQSHYLVNYCCVLVPGEPWQKNLRLVSSGIPFHQAVGYHGTLAVDPVTGAVVRLIVQADFTRNDPLRRADMTVEYGKVQIGDKEFICPVKSVAVAVAPDTNVKSAGGWATPGSCLTCGSSGAVTAETDATETLLNEVSFQNYHHFESSARILATQEPTPANSPEPVVAIQPGASINAAVQPEPTDGQHPAPVEPAGASQDQSAARDAATTPPEATPAENSAATTANDGVPSATAIASPAASDIPQTPLLRTTTREVMVDVVVTKSNGDPVTGLSKQDFTVLENNKQQTVDFFEEHTAGAHSADTPAAMPVMPTGMLTNVPPAPESDAVNVLLLDTLNTEQQDQAYVRNQVTNFLMHMQPGTRVAIFMLGSRLRFVQGFTTDTSLLLAALRDKHNGPEKNQAFQSRSDAADDQATVEMLRTMQASPFAIEALQAAQANVAAFGYGARASMTFEALEYLAQYLAGVPGRKNLLWFSESFPVILFPTAAQRDQLSQNRVTSGYLEKARDTENLFTLAKIAVYPIGAQGMMTEHVMDADVAGSGSPAGASSAATMDPYLAGAAGRADTIHRMEQLASSTGGKAFYNTNDLNAAMLKAVNDGANYYTITYSPIDRKIDGSYRQIEVKLAERKYKLAYRHGYNADDRPAADAKSGKDPLAALLTFGLPPASGVLYGVRANAAAQSDPSANRAGENAQLKGPLTRYSLDFIIRADDLRWSITREGSRTGKILIGLRAYDRDGNAINWEGNMQTLEVSAGGYGALQENGIAARLEIDLPSNVNLRLVTAVYDWNSGKAGTFELPVQQPESTNARTPADK